MKRRQFLQQAAGLGLFPLVAGALPFRSLATTSPLLTNNCEVSDRSIVLLFLNGANDIFNTTVPLSQFSEYAGFRPTIHLPEQTLINLDTSLGDEQAIGLHPRMQAFKNLYDEGLLTLVQGVGYDQPNRSHFKSTDNWLTGSGGSLQNLEEGWMGRFLADRYPGYRGLPFSQEPDPLGLLLGNTVSTGFHSMQEHRMEINLAGQDPAGFYTLISSLAGSPLTSIPATAQGNMLAYLEAISRSVNGYSERISETFNSGTNVAHYPGSSLGNQLRTIARMLSGGSRTKIFMAGKGGWDNHKQINTPGRTTEGAHANLLGDLSDSLSAFQNDLQTMGLAENVLTVVFSEFGRKVIQNGSQGNDHGTLSSMFIVGNAARGGVVGNNINLSDQDDLGAPNPDQIQYDYRQVFAGVLQDWLGANDSALQRTFIQPNYYTSRPDIISPAHLVGADCYYEPQAPAACACVRVKLFLEGYYRSSTGTMSTELAQRNLLPIHQPFTSAPYYYFGQERVHQWPAQTVDWVLVELRQSDNLSQVAARQAVLLRQDGQLMAPDGTLGVNFSAVPDGSYHLAVIHQRHLAVVGAKPILTDAPGFVYDFTLASNQAFGKNQLKALDGKWMLLAGDSDHNHYINNQDYNQWKVQAHTGSGYRSADFNGDGLVDEQDRELWQTNRARIGSLKSLWLLLLGSLLAFTSPAQSLDLLLVAQKECTTGSYCVDLQLQAASSTAPVSIGTSSLLLKYNEEALAFSSYTSERLDGSELCTGAGGAWAVHQYEAYSQAGEFHLVLFLANEDRDCPTYITPEPVTIGQVCFDIKQQGGQSQLAIDPAYTYFNQAAPNDGSNTVPLHQISLLEPPDLLVCDCPGVGLACDDQDNYTTNDRYDQNCQCQGTQLDTDQDGIPDGIDPCVDVVLEAEDAIYSGPQFRDTQSRYFGRGFLDFGATDSGYADFNFTLAQAGDYTLAFRYTSVGDRDLQLIVNGGAVTTSMVFTATSNLHSWQEASYILPNLAAGAHHLRLLASGGGAPNIDRLRVSRCTGCTRSGQACDDGNPCTTNDTYDANCNCGGRIVDLDGDLIADPCDPNVGDADDTPLEVGFVQNVGEEWITIELARTYESMVVVATPQLPSGNSPPVVTRVRHAQGNSFELKLQNPGGVSPSTLSAQSYHVHWLVVEEGVYQSTHDGIKMEARRDTTAWTSNRDNWNQVNRYTYQQNYRNPIVLGQVMTTTDEDWCTFYATSIWDRRATPSFRGFAAGKHQGENLQLTPKTEAIGILVVEAGTYTVRDFLLEAGNCYLEDGTDNQWGTPHALQSERLRGAVLSANSIRNTDGYWPVLFGASPLAYGTMTIATDEDQILDWERSTPDEYVGYLAFEAAICYEDQDQDGVCDNEDICPGGDDTLDEDRDGTPDHCDPCNDTLVGTPCDDGLACTILDRYGPDCSCAGILMDSDGDGVCNWEDVCPAGDDTVDLDADGLPDACDPSVDYLAGIPIETGIVPLVTDTWQTITLQRDFQRMVVVASSRLVDLDQPPVVTRIRNAHGNTFELRVQHPSGPIPDTFQVYYLVVEEGVYQAAVDGITLEARQVSTTQVARVGNYRGREARQYVQPYQNPVVLGQVMSANNERWSVFWSSRHDTRSSPPDAESFAAGLHIGADRVRARIPETLGLVVIEAGVYQLGDLTLEAGLGDDTVTGYGSSSTYPIMIEGAEGAVVSAAGIDGSDGYWPVLRGEQPMAGQQLALMADEDQLTDSERYHPTEQVAFAAFRGAPLVSPLKSLSTTPSSPAAAVEDQPNIATPQIQLSVYPNPAVDQLMIEARLPPGKRELKMFNMQGQLVLQQLLLSLDDAYLKQPVNIQRLPPGSYFLQLRSGQAQQVVRVVKL